MEKVKSEIRKDTVSEPPPPHSAGCSPRFPKAQGRCLEENSAHCWEPRVFQRIPKSPLEPLGCCLPGCLTTPECHNFMSSNPSWNLCHAARRGQRRLWCRMGSALHRHLLSPHRDSQPGVPGARVQQKITLPAPSLCSSALLSLYFYLLSI